MFSRLLGRSSSSNAAAAKAKEETPEQEHPDLNNNVDVVVEKIDIVVEKKKEAEPEENNEIVDFTPKKIIEAVASVEDIKVDIMESTPTQQVSLATAWIVPYEKQSTWPSALEDVLPTHLFDSMENRKCEHATLEEKMNAASIRRNAILNERVDTLYNYHNRIAHTVSVAQDVEEHALKNKVTSLDSRLYGAEERRQATLDEKRLSAALSAVCLGPEEEETTMIVPSRMDKAERMRTAILADRSARAGGAAEYARIVSIEVAAAEEEASEFIGALCEQRHQRAEVRRNIALDNIRLSCARHSNYVQSVYLTNQYMEKRAMQMIKNNMSAATFRRDVHLEEIKSNARQANLSAQFKACCAYRLLDAKWLNYALKNTASQTMAKMRRDMAEDALMQRMHEANLRRADVLAKHRLLQSEKVDAEYLDSKCQAAAYRREMNLYERKAIITERAAIIRGRKMAAATISRRKSRQAFKNKMEEASRRRHVFLENRRSKCANRNWHARVMADRQQEVVVEESAALLSNLHEKLLAAEQRRIEFQYPIFAELVSLRGKRANQVVLARAEYARRLYERKMQFEKIRIVSLRQNAMNKINERLTRVKQVKSNRVFMDSFYKQIIMNMYMARQRGAGLRRALYLDSIIANASETVDRSEYARDVLEFREEEAREVMEIKMSNAEIRREQALNKKVATARWFQDKVDRANKREEDELNARRFQMVEAAANADLRRSIVMTQKLQNNAFRSYRWQKKQNAIRNYNQVCRATQEIKACQAEARRDAMLMHKVEIARCTSNRVSVARLEKHAEGVVDAAIRTAISKTNSQNAQDRRAMHLEEIQNQAANQVKYAKGVARYQKELEQVRAEVTLENSKLRVLQTSKRRNDLMTARKLGYSTNEQLQPYAGLQVIGHAMSLTA